MKNTVIDKINNYTKILETVPPNWEICQMHRQAQYLYDVKDVNLIKDSKGNNDNKHCPCCGDIYQGPRIKICSSSTKISKYGFGLSLYFAFENFLERFLALLLIPSAISMAAYAFSGSRYGRKIGDQFTQAHEAVGDTFSWWSFGLCNLDSFAPIMMGSCILFCITYYGGSRLVSRWMHRDAKQLNTNLLDPSDYTVMITGLPLKLEKDDFVNSFSAYIGVQTTDIARVVFTNNISKFSSKMKNYLNLIRERTLRERYRNALIAKGESKAEAEQKFPTSSTGCTKKFRNDAQLANEIKELDSEIQQLQQKSSNSLDGAPIAFITFKTTAIRNNVFARFKSKLFKSINFKSVKYSTSYKIKVMKADTPNKILWENLNYTNQNGRAVVTWLITIGIMVGSFLGNYYLKSQGDKYALEISKSTHGNMQTVKIFTFVESIFVAIINVIVIIVIPIINKFEKHISFSHYHSSTNIKLALAQFINSGLIPLIVNWRKEQYFCNNGLIDQVALNWVFLIFVTPLIEIFDPLNMMRRIRMCCAKKKGDASELMQSEANDLYVPLAQPISLKYSNMLLLIYYTAFYIQLWPPGIVLMLVGIAVNYLSDKILTTCRYSKAEIPSDSIAQFSANAIVGGLILMVAANMIYIAQFDSMKNMLIYGLIPIGLLLVFIISTEYGCRGKNTCCFCNRNEQFVDMFDKIQYSLEKFGDEDYMAYNPITRKAALIESVSYKLSHTTKSEEKFALSRVHDELIQNNCNIVMHPQQFSQFNAYSNIYVPMSYQMQNYVPAELVQQLYDPMQSMAYYQPQTQYYQPPQPQYLPSSLYPPLPTVVRNAGFEAYQPVQPMQPPTQVYQPISNMGMVSPSQVMPSNMIGMAPGQQMMPIGIPQYDASSPPPLQSPQVIVEDVFNGNRMDNYGMNGNAVYQGYS